MLQRLVAVASARLRLRDDWRHILRHAWSVHWLIAAGLLDATQAVFALLGGDPPIPMQIYAPLAFLVNALAFWARLIAQKSMEAQTK